MDPNQPQTPSATVDEIDVDIEYQVSLNLSACDPGGYGLNFTELASQPPSEPFIQAPLASSIFRDAREPAYRPGK
jgi:hypothetical protein